MHRPALSIVIPCYNEAACLELLHARVSGAAKAAVGDDYEILFINDGSRDDSWPAMQRLAAADPRLIAINLSRNHGHQLALTAGLDLCADDVCWTSADIAQVPFSGRYSSRGAGTEGACPRCDPTRRSLVSWHGTATVLINFLQPPANVYYFEPSCSWW